MARLPHALRIDMQFAHALFPAPGTTDGKGFAELHDEMDFVALIVAAKTVIHHIPGDFMVVDNLYVGSHGVIKRVADGNKDISLLAGII